MGGGHATCPVKRKLTLGWARARVGGEALGLTKWWAPVRVSVASSGAHSSPEDECPRHMARSKPAWETCASRCRARAWLGQQGGPVLRSCWMEDLAFPSGVWLHTRTHTHGRTDRQTDGRTHTYRWRLPYRRVLHGERVFVCRSNCTCAYHVRVEPHVPSTKGRLRVRMLPWCQ